MHYLRSMLGERLNPITFYTRMLIVTLATFGQASSGYGEHDSNRELTD